jgi:hypothetical protein
VCWSGRCQHRSTVTRAHGIAPRQGGRGGGGRASEGHHAAHTCSVYLCLPQEPMPCRKPLYSSASSACSLLAARVRPWRRKATAAPLVLVKDHGGRRGAAEGGSALRTDLVGVRVVLFKDLQDLAVPTGGEVRRGERERAREREKGGEVPKGGRAAWRGRGVRTILSLSRRSSLPFVVGRGHVSLLAILDTWHSKPFRGIGHLLIYSHLARLLEPLLRELGPELHLRDQPADLEARGRGERRVRGRGEPSEILPSAIAQI